jgi:carboxylesterase
MKDAAPFELEGDDRAVLCIHGFTGSPYEMSYLAHQLHARGRTVVAMRLPGHGTHPEDLESTGWRDWTGAVALQFDALRHRCQKVAVVGQSLGGLLALDLAADRGNELAGVVSLATPLWLNRLPADFIRLARRIPAMQKLVRRLPKLGGSDVSDAAQRAANPSYQTIPVRALLQLDEFMVRVRSRLHEVSIPVLIVHAKRDHTAPFACSKEIASRVQGPVCYRTLTRSYHLVAFDVEKAAVAGEVHEFLCGLEAGQTITSDGQ